MDALFHKNSVVPRMTVVACLICIIVFCGLQMAGENLTWQQAELFGHYPPNAVWEGKPWALITSVFVHFQIWHIAFNLYWLWLLGNALEEEIGPWKWLLFFMVSAWVSSALQLLISGDMGIGMSGVGYALFGFGWVARRRMESFRLLLDDRTITSFFIWMVGCAVATQMGWVNIGNAAHASGLVLGAGVGAAWTYPARKWLGVLAIMASAVLSISTLFWCPTSPDWNGIQAENAIQNKDNIRAAYFYERVIATGGDKTWALTNLVLIYGQQKNSKELKKTIERLSEEKNEDSTTAEEEFKFPPP